MTYQSSSLSDLITRDGLARAWLKTMKKGGGPGGDGETIEQFARHAQFRLARLAGELESGSYLPGPLRRVSIPKASGGMRVLSIPCVVDRVVQRAATEILTIALEPQFEDSSFAYRPGRSVQQAVTRVDLLRRQGFRYVVDADIRAFFDQVPHRPLLDKMQAMQVPTCLVDLVDLWLDSFSDTGRGLAQGAPVSPILANLHLDVLDEAFGERSPVRIVRFADDFVLLTKTKPGAEAALERARDVLSDNGLELNLAKTRIVAWEQAFEFLGHLFVQATMMRSSGRDEPESAPTATLAATGLHTPARHESRFDEEEAIAAKHLAESYNDDAEAKTPSPPSSRAPNAKTALSEPEFDTAADDGLSPGLAPLYLLEPGRLLDVEGDGFAIITEGRTSLRLPAHMVGRIDLGSAVEARDEALRLAAAHQIPVTLLNEAGLPQSILLPAVKSDAGLHLAQARLALDPAFAAPFAGALAGGRIRNAQALLKRLNRRRRREDVEEACGMLHRDWRKAEAATSVEAARAAEAEAARVYWPALGHCLEHGFRMYARRTEDQATAVNAVLDYTASLLTREMRAAVLRARLHPGFGVLHASADGRDACVYDLMEAFRAPLAESLTVYLFNNRVLQADDFVGADNKGPRGQVRLAAGAGRKLIQAWEQWLARIVTDPASGKKTTWRNLMLWEAWRFARAAVEAAPFTPYHMKH